MTASDSERRESILKAAERLFRHYGPGKTTIGDIARECGIGVGSVYLEFRSKDAILSELAHYRHRRVLGAMREAARRGTAAERLSAALEARVVALLELADQGAHACDLFLCAKAAIRDSYAKFRGEELALIASLLEEGARGGEFAVEESASTAEILQRAYASFSPPWLYEQERQQVLRALRQMNELLLAGLLVRERRPAPRRSGR
jgi:AcrR family transcriptional regulator